MKKCQIASDTEVMWDITALENNCGSSTDFKCPCLGLSLKTSSLWPLVTCGLSLLNQTSWLCNSSVGLTVRALLRSLWYLILPKLDIRQEPSRWNEHFFIIRPEITYGTQGTQHHHWQTADMAIVKSSEVDIRSRCFTSSEKSDFFFNYWVMQFLRRERRFKIFKLRFNWTFNKDRLEFVPCFPPWPTLIASCSLTCKIIWNLLLANRNKQFSKRNKCKTDWSEKWIIYNMW